MEVVESMFLALMNAPNVDPKSITQFFKDNLERRFSLRLLPALADLAVQRRHYPMALALQKYFGEIILSRSSTGPSSASSPGFRILTTTHS